MFTLPLAMAGNVVAVAKGDCETILINMFTLHSLYMKRFDLMRKYLPLARTVRRHELTDSELLAELER